MTFIVTIGYQNFAIHNEEDAVRLLRILSNSTPVERMHSEDYSNSEWQQQEGLPVITMIAGPDQIPSKREVPSTQAEEAANEQL
jgi:hypothetical protein